jgi:hypothetical protein
MIIILIIIIIIIQRIIIHYNEFIIRYSINYIYSTATYRQRSSREKLRGRVGAQ